MAAPIIATPLARSMHQPAVVAPGRNTKVRARVRAQWLVLAAALTVLAGVMVAWALTRAADRVNVVSLARPVAAGNVIQSADLTTTPIAFDGDVHGLAPATSLDALVGRVATIDLRAGSLLTEGMWADATALATGERTVGAVLEAGTLPHRPRPRIIGHRLVDRGRAGGHRRARRRCRHHRCRRLRVTLAVPEADAARIAQLAASDHLVVIGLPAIAPTTAAVTEAGAPTP